MRFCLFRFCRKQFRQRLHVCTGTQLHGILRACNITYRPASVLPTASLTYLLMNSCTFFLFVHLTTFLIFLRDSARVIAALVPGWKSSAPRFSYYVWRVLCYFSVCRCLQLNSFISIFSGCIDAVSSKVALFNDLN